MPLPQAVDHGVEELALAVFPETAVVYDQNSYVQSWKVCIFPPIKMPFPNKGWGQGGEEGAKEKKRKKKKKTVCC